tara:strand:+ start:284 stop:553 length:270 start_codon:yes stop_codon:yes gene_type:complete
LGVQDTDKHRRERYLRIIASQNVHWQRRTQLPIPPVRIPKRIILNILPYLNRYIYINIYIKKKEREEGHREKRGKKVIERKRGKKVIER